MYVTGNRASPDPAFIAIHPRHPCAEAGFSEEEREEEEEGEAGPLHGFHEPMRFSIYLSRFCVGTGAYRAGPAPTVFPLFFTPAVGHMMRN